MVVMNHTSTALVRQPCHHAVWYSYLARMIARMSTQHFTRTQAVAYQVLVTGSASVSYNIGPAVRVQ